MSDCCARHAERRSRGATRRKVGHSWSVGMANPVKLPELRIEPEFKSATIEPKSAGTGDLVQWTSDGVDQFETPRRVQSVHRRDGKEWAFVEGTSTGVLLSELTVVTPESGAPSVPSMTAPPHAIAAPSANEEREHLRGQLSAAAGYRLLP